ncbi:MAG: GWxTD domain-containing protein [Lentimicrobium sp.]|jgi:GWxTD domain-containing protein|nr:GWxTD domain-containing protein [Lentimicrobium sp.]
MKKIFIPLYILSVVFATFPATAQSLQAYFSHAVFSVPGDGPYLETYLQVQGNTLKYKENASGKYQGSVQVLLIIKKDTSIVDFRKYELFSPELIDSTSIKKDFIDQQRFSLPNGTYIIDVSLADVNINDKPLAAKIPIEITIPDKEISISGIQLIESFTKTTIENVLSKSGYDLIPFVDNFFPTDKSKLTYYSEIYNPIPSSEELDMFLISAHIESFESKKMLNDFVRIKRETAKPVTAFFNEFNIENLPSGNYNLVISVRNKKNELLAQNAAFFQRFNENMTNPAFDLAAIDISNSFVLRYTNLDTLQENIRSLRPIATEMERIFINTQLMNSDISSLQQFLFNFWKTRNDIDPSGEWEKYRVEVMRVNNSYATQVKKGYDTDMGRVYLQYGPPNTITDRPFDASGLLNDPSIPYQIWHYYSINNNRERNKKFVFISSELGVRDYSLVHSDVTGEIQDYNWQTQLVRQKGDGEMDSDQIRQDRGRSATYYNNPF